MTADPAPDTPAADPRKHHARNGSSKSPPPDPGEALARALENEQDPSVRIPMLTRLARALVLADPQQGLRYACEARSLAESTGDRAALAEALLTEGECLVHLDWKSAMKLYFAALELR